MAKARSRGSSSRRKKSVARKAARKTARTHAFRMDDAHGVSHGIPKPSIKQFIESPNHSSRNGRAIDMIVLHFTDGPSAKSAINHFLQQSPRRYRPITS